QSRAGRRPGRGLNSLPVTAMHASRSRASHTALPMDRLASTLTVVGEGGGHKPAQCRAAPTEGSFFFGPLVAHRVTQTNCLTRAWRRGVGAGNLDSVGEEPCS